MRFNQGGIIRLKAVVVIVVLLAAMGVAIFGVNKFLERGAYKRTASSFVDAVIKDDANKSYDLLGKRMKDVTTKAQWTTNIKAASSYLERRKPTIVKDEAAKDGATLFGENGQARTLDYKFTLSTTTTTMHVTIYKDKGSWLVGDLSTSL